MLTLITALKGLLSLLSAVVGFFRDKLLLNAGRAAAEGDQAKEALNDVKLAQEAREEARAAASAVPPGDSLPDDGFKRND
jgi:hypothetical protein